MSTEIFEIEYQTRKPPNTRGNTVFNIFFIERVTR